MSAIKEYQKWDVVHSNTEDTTTEEVETSTSLKIKSVFVSVKHPALCQIYTERMDESGSVSQREQKMYTGQIVQSIPDSVATKFVVETKMDDAPCTLHLTSVKSQNSSCCIS